MSARVVLALGLLAAAALAAGAGGAGPTADPASKEPATARALAIRILLPGAAGAGTETVVAPPQATPITTASFTYPPAEPAVTAASTSAAATVDVAGTATGTGGATGLSLFGGEITADSVVAQAHAHADAASAVGDFDGTMAQNLVVLGSPPSAAQTSLADWGTLATNVTSVQRSAASYTGSVVALDVKLTADHGGLPAGTEIQIGYAEADAQFVPPSPAPQTVPEPKPGTVPTETTTQTETETTPAKPEPEPEPTPKPEEPAPEPTGPIPTPEAPLGLYPLPDILSPTLGGGPYVFPVFGEASYGDTYGDFRGDVSYHHGDDIFGELGQPLVAITDGTVFSVGRNKIGGNRLWLRDREGNAFYYAHLSAFSILVFNGAHVRAGQVVGFMGNTGDAETTPPHLHFEAHPVSLLYLGYDGAVDPTPYLDEWRHLARLPFPVPAGWAPSYVGGNTAPQPGAVLLDVSDISSADGLDPASLQRALEASQERP